MFITKFIFIVAFVVFGVLMFFKLMGLRNDNQQLIENRSKQELENEALTRRNNSVLQEIELMKAGENNLSLYEEFSRENYGKIKSNETFVYLNMEKVRSLPNINNFDELLLEMKFHKK